MGRKVNKLTPYKILSLNLVVLVECYSVTKLAWGAPAKLQENASLGAVFARFYWTSNFYWQMVARNTY